MKNFVDNESGVTVAEEPYIEEEREALNVKSAFAVSEATLVCDA